MTTFNRITFALYHSVVIFATLVAATPQQQDAVVSGAEYLHSAISDIKTKLSDSTHGTIDWVYKTNPGKVKKQEKPPPNRITNLAQAEDTDRSGHNYIPPPSLTKGELVALYDAALSNGGGGIVPATVSPQQALPGDDSNGYYYWYYPTNSFSDGNSNEIATPNQAQSAQVHTHTHDVKIHSLDTLAGAPPPGGGLSLFIHNLQHGRYKALEPLFMAVSSFMGMAMMFFFSMIFMPRGKPRADNPIRPPAPKTTISDVVLKAIDGHDCDERLFCEAGRVMKAFNLEDNRFVKFFQRIAPGYLSHGIEMARRMANGNSQCILIQCKKRKQNNKQTPWRSRIIPQQQKKNQQNKNKGPKRPFNNT